jgi:predicted CxxxxCH...CXXCH cytochrome family protein
VGAHQAHLLGGAIRGPIDCAECHVVPSETQHANGTVTLTWGALATAGGAAATFDATSATCSNYCHGATLRNAGDGSLKTPVWTKVDGTQAACGTCHGFPPPTNHPQSTECHLCHQDTVDANGKILVANGKHIDGAIEVTGGGCSGCHGSNANPAPPVGTHGETATTTLAVGAHQAHVNDGAIHKALSCEDCHVVPTSLANHPDGTIHMAWSVLATGNGATTPVLDTAAATCAATYCHGATLTTPGGSAKTPVWTKVDGSQAQCDSCHGNPPGNWHPPNPLCNSCHPLTVAIDGTIDVAGGRHIDGTVEVAGLTCHSCHGSTTNPAPPADTRGNSATTFVGVGAHQAHLLGGAIRGPIDCTECHVVPTETLHANGTVTLTWGPLATAGGATATFDATSATCSNYCHGAAFRPGDGTLRTPVWTKVDSTQAACGTCHGFPPPPDHPQSTQCYLCHKDTVDANGNILVANGTHIDGRIEAGGDCGTCHGIPPADGAHASHAMFPDPKVPTYGDLRIAEDYTPQGPPAYQFGCGNCHPLDPAKHMDLVVEVELSPAGAPAGTIKSRNAPTAAYDKASGTCRGAYCHSSGQQVPVFAVTPGWTSGATLRCDGCHSNPPAYPSDGPGAPVANSHLGLADTGREFGHFVGLAGALHDTKHGGGVYGASEAAAPITCQTCHYETTDPATTGRSTFYWLDTNGRYVLPGGDPGRSTDPRWQATQCGTCHAPSGPALVASGRVLPLRHVNGRRDVVFDPRTALPPYAGLPEAPDRPSRPYWVTHAAMCDPFPPVAVLDGTTMSFDLSGARWDPATKTCSSVPCHLADTPRWGGGYAAKAAGTASSCCACHGGTRCGR